jgi:hypothetical protein
MGKAFIIAWLCALAALLSAIQLAAHSVQRGQLDLDRWIAILLTLAAALAALTLDGLACSVHALL